MSKFYDILNTGDASDALLGEQIDKLEEKLANPIPKFMVFDKVNVSMTANVWTTVIPTDKMPADKYHIASVVFREIGAGSNPDFFLNYRLTNNRIDIKTNITQDMTFAINILYYEG